MNRQIVSVANIKKTIRYLQKNGLKHTFYAARERVEEEKKAVYVYQKPDGECLKAQRADSEKLPYRISIVVPAYETKEEFLLELIDSVREQSYEKWELIIADAGKSRHVEETVRRYQERDKRICYLRLRDNNGIAENTNAGIEAASGDYIALLDHDDVLTPDALYEMASAVENMKKTGKTPVMIYSDEDKFEKSVSQSGEKYHYMTPNQKSNFNLDLIMSNNYICHLMMIESGLLKMLKLRKEYDGAQDYDCILRIIRYLLSKKDGKALRESIVHVPKVLYHWRCHEQSTADNTDSKIYAYEAGKAALEDFCQSQGWTADVEHSLHLGFYQITYQPDMFSVRPDVGIIGGRILDGHNKITSGIYDGDGNRLYQGVHKEYSGGATHRAALVQDCAAVDIRCMRIRKELYPFFKEITGVSYRETGTQKLADVSAISCDDAGYRKLSMELGKAAARMGYLTVWNPQITIKLKGDLIK
ncbi:MAG: glycosyltransferase [Clostridium sp.]|nr:glycosyltransferase [Clostridium sp.]